MSDVTSAPGRAAGAATPQAPGAGGRSLSVWDVVEVALAVAAFAVLCVLVLRTPPYLSEPDDHAYQASIIAMTDGHFLTLSSGQVQALQRQIGAAGGLQSGPFGPVGIAQWTELADGRWISEKDPGYPFLAVTFQELGIIRLAPLFYGALACIGLFAGARRWLGRLGGAAAVGLYCSSGAAMLWGWRDYMPTFTDASLIAAGSGALLWAVLATEARPRRRIMAGLVAFAALEAAVFTRYTDIVVLGCAVLTVVAVRLALPARLPRGALPWWLGSAAVFGVGVAIFDDLVYGGPLRSGYRPGEIRFSLSAIGPNLRYMPAHLLQAMPALIAGLAALAWMTVRWLVLRRSGGPAAGTGGAGGATGTGGVGAARMDVAVGAALAASWLAVWGLYATYTWTAQAGGTTLQVARFYVPALGAIALLGAWLVTRLPGRGMRPALAALACVVAGAAMFGIGDRAFGEMVASRIGAGVVYRCGPGAPGRPGGRGPVPCGPVHVRAPIGPPSRRPGQN